jgi:hypothetical protein
MPDDRDDRDYQKNVNQATSDWEHKEAQSPKNN